RRSPGSGSAIRSTGHYRRPTPRDGCLRLCTCCPRVRGMRHGGLAAADYPINTNSQRGRVYVSPLAIDLPARTEQVSAAQAQSLDGGAVTLDVLVRQVLRQPLAAADEGHQAVAGVVIVLVLLQVLGDVGDALGQQRDLRLRGTGVLLVQAVLGQNGLLLFGGQRHGGIRPVSQFRARMVSGSSRRGSHRGPQQTRGDTVPEPPRRPSAGPRGERIPARPGQPARMRRALSTSRPIAAISSSSPSNFSMPRRCSTKSTATCWPYRSALPSMT